MNMSLEDFKILHNDNELFVKYKDQDDNNLLEISLQNWLDYQTTEVITNNIFITLDVSQILQLVNNIETVTKIFSK